MPVVFQFGVRQIINLCSSTIKTICRTNTLNIAFSKVSSAHLEYIFIDKYVTNILYTQIKLAYFLLKDLLPIRQFSIWKRINLSAHELRTRNDCIYSIVSMPKVIRFFMTMISFRISFPIYRDVRWFWPLLTIDLMWFWNMCVEFLRKKFWEIRSSRLLNRLFLNICFKFSILALHLVTEHLQLMIQMAM